MKYLLAFLLVTPAWAQTTTYVYTGQYMTGTLTGTPVLGYVPTVLTGTVTFSQPLADNQANQVVTPTSYNFDAEYLNSEGVNELPNSPPSYSFSFSTVNGAIVSWTVTAYGSWADGAGHIITQFASTETGDTYSFFEQTSGCPGFTGPCPAYNVTSTSGGIWARAGAMPDPPATDPLQAQLDAANAQIASLQKQLTHVTSEMEVYRQGVVTYEAEFLAWESRAYYCQAHQGKC